MELRSGHGLKLDEVGQRLGRSKSWVCRRLGLVEALPLSVQALVQTGQLCAHAATKYLVPLARANRKACEGLVLGMKGRRLSSRQVGQLYVGWRRAAPEDRGRIVAQPLLYLKAAEEALASGPDDESSEKAVGKDLGILTRVCQRLSLRVGESPTVAPRLTRRWEKRWGNVCVAFATLRTVWEDWFHAGP